MLQSPPPSIPPEDFAILARSAASPQALADLVALYRRLQPEPALAYNVLEAVPLNVVLCDRNSRIVMVSTAIGELLGIPVEDLLGRTFDDIALLDFDTPGGGRVRVQFADALNGKPTIAQLEQLWEPLPPVTLEYTLTPVTTADGQVSHVLFTLRDVTEAVSGQQAMKEASAAGAVAARYRTLVQSLPVSSVLMFDHDLRYVIVEGGESLREQGLDPAQFPGATLYDLVPDDKREQAIDEYKRTLAGEEITRIVERGDRIFRSRYVPVRDDDGAVIAGLLVNEDITAERKSEEALRLSERRFRALAASIPASTVLVFDHDLRYVIVEGHDVFARHGYDADDMRGRTLREVIRPEAYAAVAPLYRATLAGEEIRTEFTRDGHVYETHFFPVYDDHGAVTYGTALTEDVTHARKAQEALRLSEQRFRALATSIPDSAVLIFDHDLRYVIVEGRTVLALYGYDDAATIIGKTLYDIADEDDRLAYNEMLYQAALEGRELKVEVERSGHILLARFFPIRDDNGQVRYGALLLEDITDAKQKEAALRESQARFERAFAISPLGMALVDLDGRFVETNISLQRMLGYSADELRQRTTADVTHPDDRHIRSASELLEDSADDHFQIDKRYVHKDGRTVWGRLHVTLLRT
ncbi:MAG TPA: PAS domain-containing protein, partial [Aggregatilineales bacterium]|nr:PAS domain-containing protein [Aggregatilineales bacterium]